MVLLKKYHVYCTVETQTFVEWNTVYPADCPNDGSAIAFENDDNNFIETMLPFGNIKTITDSDSPFTVDGYNLIIDCDTSGGSITINLPSSASEARRSYHFRKTSASNTVTIDADGAELIDGSATATLTSNNQVLTITSDGTGWDSNVNIVSNQLDSITDPNDHPITGGASAAINTRHSDLVNLTTGDDHTQYAFLAGRSGGQSIIGGTAAGEDLTLESTSNASKGTIKSLDPIEVNDIDTRTATTLLIGKSTATKVEIADTGIVTEIQGNLDALEGVDVTGNITVSGTMTADDLDTNTATTLLLGKSTATKVEIADTGIVTEIQGNLDALEGVDVTGNITVSGTVDGRDIATDGSNLDNLYTTIGLSALTSGEVDQLENIGTTTISATQWGYLGSTDQNVGTTDNVTFNQITGTLQTASQPNINHGSLAGIADDDHTQYTLLVGRSGGQTLIGGTASGNNLILRSTSNATKGQVYIDETTTSTSSTTGALRIGGGVGIAENLNVAENASFGGTAVTDYRLTVKNVDTKHGINLRSGDTAGDIALHIGDTTDTIKIMEIETGTGFCTFGKTYAQTNTDNGVVYGIDNQHTTASVRDFNTQSGGYRIAGKLMMSNTEFQQSESDGNSSTTSGTFQQKLRLTTGSLPSGTYRLGYTMEILVTGLAGTGGIRVQQNDTTDLAIGGTDVSVSEYQSFAGYKYLSSISGVHNFDIDYRATIGTINIRRARLEIWRVS